MGRAPKILFLELEGGYRLVIHVLCHFLYLFFFFLPCLTACGILVPHEGLKPCPLRLETQSPNHWTAREFSVIVLKISLKVIWGASLVAQW